MNRIGKSANLKVGDKKRHDLVADVIAQTRERLHCEYRIAPQRGFRERYLADEIHLEVGIKSREGRHFCAVLYRPVMSNLLHMKTADVAADPNAPHRISSEVESAVLVDPVKLMDDPQGVFDVGGLTVVRLHALDDLSRVAVDPLEFGSGRTVEAMATSRLVSITDDDELGGLLKLGRDNLRALECNGKFQREMVKGCSQRVYSVTDYQSQLGRGWFANLGSDDCATRLGIRVRYEAVSISPEPRLRRAAEIFYVLARPIEFPRE